MELGLQALLAGQTLEVINIVEGSPMERSVVTIPCVLQMLVFRMFVSLTGPQPSKAVLLMMTVRMKLVDSPITPWKQSKSAVQAMVLPGKVTGLME